MSALKVTANNFEEVVMHSDKPVLVDFWATWCGPCQMVGPVLEEIADEHSEIKVCKVNVDEERKLAMKYQVMSIPTMMVVKNGEVVRRTVGAMGKDEILDLLK